jgi:trk system potassium uptake protein TrkA
MKVVIVGDGKVGYTLTEELSREGHDVVVVDSNEKTLENTVDVFDVIGVVGNGASMDVQAKAGVGEADILIAATSLDEVNMLACIVAKKLGAKHTIARIRNHDYARQLVFLKEELGLSMAVNPDRAAASDISRLLRFPEAVNVEVFSKGRVELAEFVLTEENHLDGIPLKSMYELFPAKILVCAVQRGEQVFIPNGDFVLQKEDRISVTAAMNEMDKFARLFDIQDKIKKVLIVGGSRIAYYLSMQLQNMGITVKIIEINPQRCEVLAELLPKVLIINGDGTDIEVLQEESLEEADAFIALTDMDEENIILSMLAKVKNTRKVITKIDRISFVDLLGDLGIDSVISPKKIAADRIVGYVRAMENSADSNNVEALHRIVGGKVEAMEFHIRSESAVKDKPLRDLNLKPNLLVASIVRGTQVMIPGGESVIQAGDAVVVVTAGTPLYDIDDILA